MYFHRDSLCKRCPLHESAKHPCLRMELLEGDPLAKDALVVVGEKPGRNEDAADHVFIGEVGKLARTAYIGYITANVDKPLAVYGTNAVRCAPPSGVDITESQAKKCSLYLWDDLVQLQARYDHVYILACGAPASKAVSGSTLGRSLRKQGQPVKLPGGPTSFFTFNPGILLPGRDPSMASSIKEHLLLAIEYLNTGKITTDLVVPKYRGCLSFEPHDHDGSKILSLDIETHGAVSDAPPQSTFHPKKMRAVDGASTENLLQTAAVAWRESSGEIGTAVWTFPEDTGAFISFIGDCTKKGWSILGQNLCFDLMCLRDVIPEIAQLISRARSLSQGWKLLDLSIANFMEDDTRPEKSLKELALLLRVHKYDEERSLRQGFRYDDRHDPELHYYNCADVAATLECWDRLKLRTLRGSETARFSEYCLAFYSDILWTILEMGEAGVCYDRDKLKALDETLRAKAEWCEGRSHGWWGLRLSGKGSQNPLRNMVRDAANEAGLAGDKRLAISKKTKIVSTGKDNRNLIVGCLPISSIYSRQMRMLGTFKRARDARSRYTTKYLTKPREGLVGRMAYPTWYPCPTYDSDGAGKAGGTKQGRLTCSNPGVMTDPKEIKACYTSRFPGGVVLECDLSQIELRVSALLSGDPVMMREYEAGVDRHLATGATILASLRDTMRGGYQYGVCKNLIIEFLTAYNDGRADKLWDGIRVWRQLGKTVNFLMNFKGGANTLQATARRDNRIELDLSFCNHIIRSTSRKYARLTEWQNELISEVCRKQYMELPLIGDRRSFRGSPKTIRATYITNICNYPIQTIAARILQSAQRQIGDAIQRLGLKTKIVRNVYDAIDTDSPPEEEEPVRGLFDKYIDNPPFYVDLQRHLGRELKIEHEIEVLARRNT